MGDLGAPGGIGDDGEKVSHGDLILLIWHNTRCFFEN